jgi:hypothetical protein
MNRAICMLASAPRRVARLVWSPLALAPLAVAAALPFLVGCTPGIGDKCTLSTDCSVTGTLVCDTSQPSGYCTVLNCTDDSCPNSAVCVMFQSTVPGCAYDDYQSPSRTGRSFCMKHCSQDSDCRQSDGYICGDPTGTPWHAAILDNNQSQGVCIIAPGLLSASVPQGNAAVCQATEPDAEASPETGTGTDASAEGGDAGTDGRDAAVDARVEGGPDVADAGGDSGLSGGVDAADGQADGQNDALNDASGDAGFADAPGGG